MLSSRFITGCKGGRFVSCSGEEEVYTDLLKGFLPRFTRNSTSTLTDFEGLIKEALPNEIRYEGYRRVENLLLHAQDITQSPWQAINGSVIVDYQTLRLTGTNRGLVQVINIGGHIPGDTYILRAKISGTGTVSLTVGNASSSDYIQKSITLTSTPTEYFVKHIFTITTSQTLKPGIFKRTGDTVNGDITITDFQVEQVTGQTNQNPSEFTLPQWQSKCLYFPNVGNTKIDTNIVPTLSGELEVEFDYNGNTYDVMIGSWNGVDKRCYIGVAPTGELGAGIGNDNYQAALIGTTVLISGTTYKGRIIWDQSDIFLYLKTKTNGVWNYWQLEKTKVQDGDVNTSLQLTIGVLNKNNSTYTNEYLGCIRNVYIRDGVGDIAYYKIDETEGEIAYDSSGNDNHGVIHNFSFFPKYYDTENGNTVDGAGVITETPGPAIPEDTKKGILIEAERKDLFLQTEELTTSPWVKSPTIDLVEESTFFKFRKSWRVFATPKSGAKYLYQNVSVNVYTYTISMWVRSNNGIAQSGRIYLNSGASAENFSIPATGEIFIQKIFQGVAGMQWFGFGTNIEDSDMDYVIENPRLETGSFSTSYIPTVASQVTRLDDDLKYELGAGNFPQEFTFLAEVTPAADGADYGDSEIRLFSTNDNRGTSNEIRTLGGSSYSYTVSGGGGYITLNRVGLIKNQKTKYGFSFKQEDVNVRVLIVKNGVEKLNFVVRGTLNHSNTGMLAIGNYDTAPDYFYGDFKNISLYNYALTTEEIQKKQEMSEPVYLNLLEGLLPSLVRNSTATLFDFEGLMKTALPNEIRYEGYRRVENLLLHVQDITQPSWQSVGGSTIVDYQTLTLDGLNHGLIQAVELGGHIPGDTYVFRAKISGVGTVRLELGNSNSSDIIVQHITLSSTPTEYAIKHTFTTTSTRALHSGIFKRTGDTVNGDITVTDFQVEQVTGQTNQNPSEFVSVDVLASPWHGAGVDGVQYFGVENGNTVDSVAVITEAVGSVIPEDTKKGILREVKSTNTLVYSKEFDNSIYYISNVTVDSNTIVAPNGTLTADTIVSTTTNSQHKFHQYSAEFMGDITISIFVHKDSTIPYIQLLGGSVGTNYFWANFNLSTKTQGNSGAGSNGTFYTSYIETQGDWTRYSIVGNTDALFSTYHQFFLLDSDITTAGNSYNYAGSTSENVIVWGMQFENNRFPTSYIHTEALTVTREADQLSYNLGAGNFPQEFTLITEVIPVSKTPLLYTASEVKVFSTRDTRSVQNEILTKGDISYGYTPYGAGGGYFKIDRADFEGDQKTKFGFSTTQEGDWEKVLLIKDGVEEANVFVSRVTDHSNTGILDIGGHDRYLDYFSGTFKNIVLYKCGLTTEEIQTLMED